jgi:hypothetical protein
MPERETESALMKYGMFIVLYLIFGIGLHILTIYFLAGNSNKNGVVWSEQKTSIIVCIELVCISLVMTAIYLGYYSLLDFGTATNILFLVCCFAFGMACWALECVIISKK